MPAHPSLARRWTIARPIPDAAPVTSAKPGTPRALVVEVVDSPWLTILFEMFSGSLNSDLFSGCVKYMVPPIINGVNFGRKQYIHTIGTS
jgi:hypothetical protein